MTVNEVLKELKALGNEKMRAHNAKNGAGKDQFGVKLGDIRNVAKKVGSDHELALALWETGNVEARLVATLAMKPKKLTAKEVDRLVRSVDFVQVADWLNSYVVKQHPEKETLRQDWMTTKQRWASRSGWSLTSERVEKNPDGLDVAALLDRIESEMPKADPVVQWTMNFTLGNIGIHFPKHRKRAVAIGEKLGLYRDWPVSKGCIPPFVPVWVEAIVARKG